MAEWITELAHEFKCTIENPDCSVGIAVIKILNNLVIKTNAKNLTSVNQEINFLLEEIQKLIPNLPLHFFSTTQFFRTGLSLASTNQTTNWKEYYTERAGNGLKDADTIISSIPIMAEKFIHHGMTILTRGNDQIVFLALSRAAQQKKIFKVVITEGKPFNDGLILANKLKLKYPQIPISIIPDSSIGLIMNETDIILIGTDLVLQDGGLIAFTGTYSMCALANIHKKPVYCICESLKFSRKFILSPFDLNLNQRKIKYEIKTENDLIIEADARQFDYTPAKYITFIITEKGPMPPSAVTSEITRIMGVS